VNGERTCPPHETGGQGGKRQAPGRVDGGGSSMRKPLEFCVRLSAEVPALSKSPSVRHPALPQRGVWTSNGGQYHPDPPLSPASSSVRARTDACTRNDLRNIRRDPMGESDHDLRLTSYGRRSSEGEIPLTVSSHSFADEDFQVQVYGWRAVPQASLPASPSARTRRKAGCIGRGNHPAGTRSGDACPQALPRRSDTGQRLGAE
jgi:hypothetical protein